MFLAMLVSFSKYVIYNLLSAHFPCIYIYTYVLKHRVVSYLHITLIRRGQNLLKKKKNECT